MRHFRLENVIFTVLIWTLLLWIPTTAWPQSALKLKRNEPAPFPGILLDEYAFRDLKASESLYIGLVADYTELQLECSHASQLCNTNDYRWSYLILGIGLGLLIGIPIF